MRFGLFKLKLTSIHKLSKMKLRTLTLLLIIIYQFSAVLTLHLRTQSQNLRKQNGFLKTHIKNIKDDD